MTIRANTTKEEVDAAAFGDLSLIARTLGIQVSGIAVEDIYVLRANIDMRKEIVPHKRMVALRMLLRKAYVFIHIECNHILKADYALLIELDKVLIHTEG